MAPPDIDRPDDVRYNPDDVSALREAAAAISGLVQVAEAMNDRDQDVPSDLLDTLRSLIYAAEPAIPAGHAVIRILPRLSTGPTFATIRLYGPPIAKVLYEISNNIERTNHSAESRPRSPQVTVYVNPTDRKRSRQRHARPPSGKADQ